MPLLVQSSTGVELSPPVQAATASDGVYSEEQAARGEGTYQRECAQCHLADLGGDGLRATPLVGDVFLGLWRRRRVGDLFKVIKVTMPADRPSSLTDQDYADITAYILKMNKYPAGPKPLVTDRDALLLIAFERP